MSMKKLLLGMVLALPLPALADSTFFWRTESETLTADDKSSGDTTGNFSGGPTISATAMKVGSNGLLLPDSINDSVIFDSASVINHLEGSVGQWINWRTAYPGSGNDANGLTFVNAAAVTNIIGLRTSGSDEIRFQLRRETASAGVQLFLSSTACNLTFGNWYYIIYRWDIPNDDRAIACYDSTGALIQEVTDLSTDLAATEAIGIDTMRFGTAGSSGNAVWIDTIQISQEFDEPIQNFIFETSFVPTFTSGPTNGSFTNTTLPFTYTSDQFGDVYAAACTNGQTIATFAALKTGTCSGGAAVGTGTDTAAADVGDTVTITGLVAGTTYDVYIGVESQIGGQSAISSLADRATTSASVAMSSTNVTALTDGYTVAGTCTGSGTLNVEAVACALGDAVPTSNEIEAGQCGGGNAALMNANENWTTAVPNNFTLTSASKPAKLDVYMSCTNGTTDSSVETHANEFRTLLTGFAVIEPSDISATSIFDLDAYFNPDVTANQDLAEYEDDTNESANCNVLFATDGDFVLYDATDGVDTEDLFPGIDETGDAGDDQIADCDGKVTFNIHYELGSSATTGLFTAPAVGNFTTADLICNGNSAPVWELTNPSDEIQLFIEDAPIETMGLSGFSSDADPADTDDYAIASGTLPPGLSLSATTGDITGTPNTQDEVGAVVQFTRTDECGDSSSLSFAFFITDNAVTTPNCVGGTTAACMTALDVVRPWLETENQLTATFAYDAVVAEGNIISQNPAAAAVITAEAPLEVVVSLGVEPEGGIRGRLNLRLELGIH